MKETVKTSRTAGYLEKIFRALNVKYFNGELEEPIITIQSTPRAYGHVTVAKPYATTKNTSTEIVARICVGLGIPFKTFWDSPLFDNIETRQQKEDESQ